MKSLLPALICSTFLLLIPINSLHAQENNSEINAGYHKDIYNAVLDAYKLDQVLATGICYEDDYRAKEGHPFLFDDQFYKGTLTFRGRKYQGVDLKYDIYKQQVILFIKQDNSISWIIPPNDYISSFNLNDKLFANYTFEGIPGFYQVIYDSEALKCLYYWSKQRYDSDHNGVYNSSKFTASERKTFLVNGNDLLKYGGNASFIRLFPKENQMLLKQYIRNKKIKVAQSSDAEMKELLSYCKTLLSQ